MGQKKPGPKCPKMGQKIPGPKCPYKSKFKNEKLFKNIKV